VQVKEANFEIEVLNKKIAGFNKSQDKVSGF